MDQDSTNESIAKKSEELEFDFRFVVLEHTFPKGHKREKHWDLMIESESNLLTWALEQLPIPDVWIKAKQLADHRMEYLEYEGPVSDDRGVVTRTMQGKLAWENGDKRQGVLDFDSRRWRVEMKPPGSGADDKTWMIRFADL